MIRLLYSPLSLPTVAAKCRTRTAALFGIAACSLDCGSVLSGVATGMGEPYPDLGSFVEHILASALGLSAIFALIMCGLALIFISPTIIAPWFTGRVLHKPSVVTELRFRIFCLSPACLLLPSALWGILSGLAYAQSPSFGLGSGKPAWLMSPLITSFGSGWWLFVGVALLVVICALALRQVPDLAGMLQRPTCQACGYDLTGNVSGVCPECGKPT